MRQRRRKNNKMNKRRRRRRRHKLKVLDIERAGLTLNCILHNASLMNLSKTESRRNRYKDKLKSDENTKRDEI